MNIVSTIIAPVAAFVGELERRRLHRRTERMIGSLPEEVQKDIGWPGAARGLGNLHEPTQSRPAAC